MAIVWRTRLNVDGYAAAGRDLVVPGFDCPGCSTPMGWWGWYRRDVRVFGDAVTIWVRRVRCSPCRRSHAVLPEFVAFGRLDEVEGVGLALSAMLSGVSAGRVAVAAGVGHSTARSWRARFRCRAGSLLAGLVAAVVAVSGLAPREHRDAELGVVEVVELLRAVAERRWPGQVGTRWRLANVMVGGHLLSTNMDPLWSAR